MDVSIFIITFAVEIKKNKIMSKEEVTLEYKYTKWKIWRKVKGKFVSSIETTPKPMSCIQALKYFGVNTTAVQAIVD